MNHMHSQKEIKIIKPSPNEEVTEDSKRSGLPEAIIRNALAERRKQRLLQVRKQEKNHSGKIRTVVKNRRENEMKKFRMQQQREWNRKISEKIEELEAEYRKRIESLGEGHKSADEIPVQDPAQSNRIIKQRALQRYEEALEKLVEQRDALKKVEEDKALLRQKVAKTEQARASAVASKPPPIQDFDINIGHITRQTTLSNKTKITGSFSSTRFHMQSAYVEKAEDQPQVGAREAARDFEERITQARELLEKDLNERKEKANLRHQYARQQVLLDQSKDRLLEQLDDLEFKDRVRRQQILSKIPKQVFQPPYQRVEDAKARQIILEEAFENAHRSNKDLHDKELVLDLEDELAAIEKDLQQQEESRQQDAADIQSNASDMESKIGIPFQPEVGHVAKTQPAELTPDEKEAEEVQPKRLADPSKRMQKLLGRIRQQQDEWSKQNFNRRIDSVMKNDQVTEENESSDSLVSADINSAQYTNSNAESNENVKDGSKPKEEKSLDNDVCSQRLHDEEQSLLHPFEKAKLIRSAGRRPEEVVESDGLASSISTDLDRRKKTLENQKYLFKIQRQRLENHLLRRDLHTTKRELGLLAEEDANSSTHEVSSGSAENGGDEISHANETHRLNELLDHGKEVEDSESLGPEKELKTIEEEDYEGDSEGPSTCKSNCDENSVGQAGISFVSGLSDIQRETLSKRYPNIFKGLSFVKADKDETQSGIEQAAVIEENQGKTSDEDRVSENHIATLGKVPRESILVPSTGESRATAFSSSKPRVEIERIRKYQEQLLQKQKWLKNRHEVMQKRHEDMMTEFTKSDGKPAETQMEDEDIKNRDLLFSENVDSSHFSNKQQLSELGTVGPLEEKHVREAIRQYEINGARIIDVEGEEKLGIIESSGYKGDVNVLVQEETPAQPQELLRTNEERTHISDKDITKEREIFTAPDEREELNCLEGDERKDNDQREMENEPSLGVGRQSNFDDLQALLNEIDSIHLQANAATAEAISLDPHLTELRKSHRVISEKPAFSPIQEIEETPFRETDFGVVASQNQGTASVSSLAEQELPSSTRTLSEVNHFSPVRSTKSNERSEMSSAFSLRELISSLSETDYLPLPRHSPQSQVRPNERKGHLLNGDNHPPAGPDLWTPLQPYFSGAKDNEVLEHQTEYQGSRKLQIPNDAGIRDLSRSRIGSGLEFDEEKYRKLVKEHLRFPTASPRNTELADMHNKQTDVGKVARLQEQPSGLVEMASLGDEASGMVEIDELRLPEIPMFSSGKWKEQPSRTSMKEASAVSISSASSSSNVSKGSWKSMTKYEEILEHVRTLPYKYREEYNKMSESYESWRKETVEPLLQPDIPDIFDGYGTLTNRERGYDKLNLVGEVYSREEKSQDIAYQPLEMSHMDNKPEAMAQGMVGSRIQLYEPVLHSHLHVESEEIRSDEASGADIDDEEARANVYAEVTLPLYTSRVSKEDIDTLLEVSRFREPDQHSHFPTDRDGSLLSDQLTEQKFSEIANENDLQNESLHLEGYATDSANNILQDRDSHGFQKDSEFDFEVRQRRFLEQYISSFGTSSATKSSLTNSSSRKSKSLFSFGIQSDQTVSELAQLWSRVSHSTKEGDNEIDESVSQANSDHFQRGHSSHYSGTSDSSDSVTSSKHKVLIKRQESPSEQSIGFRDPNNYDISLYKSMSFKTSKMQPDSQLSSSRSDETSHLPTLPNFASTLLEKDQPSLDIDKSSTPAKDMQPDLHESLDSNQFEAVFKGHSDTSWLLPSDTLGLQPESRLHVEEISTENAPSVVKFHALGSDDGLHVDSKESPTSASSHDDFSGDRSVRTWGELLTAQVSGSSAKESDGELPDVLQLRKEAFIRRSQQRVQQTKRKHAKKVHGTKFRVDGRVEKSERKKTDKENKEPSNPYKEGKKSVSSAVSGVRSNSRSKLYLPNQSKRSTQKDREILQENKRQMQEFQKKIQSSLRSRRK